MCNCRICTQHRRWHAALNPQTEEAKAAYDEMWTNIEGAETDAGHWRAIFDGSWPSAEEQLTNALERIRSARTSKGVE